MFNKPRILIADDNDLVLETLSELYGQYDPLLANSVTKAKDYIDCYGEDIKLIICDVDFKTHENGLNVYSHSRDKLGLIPFIFHSSLSSQVVEGSLKTDPQLFAFDKPANLDALSNLIFEIYNSKNTWAKKKA